jgi:hypothetical protein
MPSRLAALALTVFAIGCFPTHIPPAGHQHMQVRWAASYRAAADEAQRTNKPMLVCLVAGEVDGPC